MGRGGGTVVTPCTVPVSHGRNTRRGVAIVTGGSRGLGLHIAKGLADDGHKVVVLRRRARESRPGPLEPDWLNDSILQLEGIDVTNEVYVQSAIAQTMETFGQVDILVNNAAYYTGGTTENTELSEWVECLGTNLTGAFLMTKHVLPVMQRRKYGRIVNIGSFGGHAGAAGAAAYNASKAGLLGLTKTVANENARYGITCNLVSPGCIDVGIFSRFPDEIKEKLLKLTPMDRPAIPDEVVWPVRWLCSPEASYITGQALNVDGGIS